MIASEAPFFSIAIPTRNRSGLARLAAAHVLSQDFGDLELILLDNSDQCDLTTAEFEDNRCKVVPTTSVLSMRDNWERTLSLATGKYVMILSDKDMLLPGALRRIAEAIAESNGNMINFRKASYSSVGPIPSFVQLCSGLLVEKEGSEVLHAWFDEVAHFHDAPMIYNSAVRRDVLIEMRNRSGEFFVGASPDLGSGMLLMALLTRYHVLDRPLAVSWFGDWSIGMDTMRGGKGAAAAFISELRSNPFRDAGLVTCLPGAVAETALACKARFPSLFQAYDINWSAYVCSVLAVLMKREQGGRDASEERRFLLDTRGKKYSRSAVRAGQAQFFWSSAVLPNRIRGRLERLWRRLSKVFRSVNNSRPLPPAVVTSSSESAEGDLSRYFGTPRNNQAAFREVPCLSLPWARSVADVEYFASVVNDRLDNLTLWQ